MRPIAGKHLSSNRAIVTIQRKIRRTLRHHAHRFLRPDVRHAHGHVLPLVSLAGGAEHRLFEVCALPQTQAEDEPDQRRVSVPTRRAFASHQAVERVMKGWQKRPRWAANAASALAARRRQRRLRVRPFRRTPQPVGLPPRRHRASGPTTARGRRRRSGGIWISDLGREGVIASGNTVEGCLPDDIAARVRFKPFVTLRTSSGEGELRTLCSPKA